MKLLLDEMYSGLREYFETLGYQVQTAQEAGLKAAKDRENRRIRKQKQSNSGNPRPKTCRTRRTIRSQMYFYF